MGDLHDNLLNNSKVREVYTSSFKKAKDVPLSGFLADDMCSANKFSATLLLRRFNVVMTYL